jgi:two-component system chemotaxis sensor kinase CheA
MSVRRVMVVDVGDGAYGIALEQVLEMVKVAPEDVHRHAGLSRIALRDRLIPLVDVRRALRLPARTLAEPGTDPAPEGGSLSVVVVETEAGEAGLVVDRFRASAEIIPKPLHGPLSGVGYLTGAALMGDGSVLLLMDPREVARCLW